MAKGLGVFVHSCQLGLSRLNRTSSLMRRCRTISPAAMGVVTIHNFAVAVSSTVVRLDYCQGGLCNAQIELLKLCILLVDFCL